MDEPDADADAVAEAEEVRWIRAQRDAALTPGQRLERLDELLKQLAQLRPAGER